MPTQQGPTLPVRQSEESLHGARIKVIGVGGGGNNAIDRMIASGMEGVEFVAFNTDIQALQASKAEVRQQIGARLTQGLGAGSDPDIGRRAALQDSDLILEALDGADMVFVTAGLGGGTGTGAAPVIAALASETGALTVAIVTRPFGFEGKRRMAIADWGIHHLLNYVDTLIVIPNEKLLAVARDAPFFESFRIADDFLRQAVQGISDIITTAGVINRDFADVKTTMAGMGYGMMGTASRSGPNRAIDAVMGAMASPLLEDGVIDGARGILINVTGSSSLRLSEVNAASTVIQSVAHEDANIIFGAVLDERLGDEVKVTVIATGFSEEGRIRAERRGRLLREPAAAVVPEKAVEPAPIAQAVEDSIAVDVSYSDLEAGTFEPAPASTVTHDAARDEPSRQHELEPAELSDEDLEADHTPKLVELDMTPKATATDESSQGEESAAVSIEEESIEEDSSLAAPSYEAEEHLHDEAEPMDVLDEPSFIEEATIDEDANGPWQEQGLQAEEEIASVENEPVYVERQLVPAASVELALPEQPVVIQREPVRLTHFRRAAMAAYTAAASPDEEPAPLPSPRTDVSSGFAEVLEARRRFVEAQSTQEPEVEAEPTLSAEEERAIAVLMEAMAHHEAWEQEEAKSQEEFEDAVFTPEETAPDHVEFAPVGDDMSLIPDQPARIPDQHASDEPDVESHPTDLLRPATVTYQQQEFFPLRQTYESGETPRPLPDFKRRLYRDASEDPSWQTADIEAGSQLHTPALETVPETDGSTDEFDELEIPAFLRRGRA